MPCFTARSVLVVSLSMPLSAIAGPPPSEALQAIEIPADGKYTNVKVEGVTVPMIEIMKNGTIVLVDTDGKKPRTWEEQYKRQGDLPKGYFDLHKTDQNHNASFRDDPVDRKGRWKMDTRGNITKD